MLAISPRRVELGPVPGTALASSARRWPPLALAALCVAACERPTAPVALVYADRPVVVPASAEGWRTVSVGGRHSCGVRLDERLYCWGSNTSGQLGVIRALLAAGADPSAAEFPTGRPEVDALLAPYRPTA